jgi:preprotein translocase subunit SecA
MATVPALLNPPFLPSKPPNQQTALYYTKPILTLPFSLTHSFPRLHRRLVIRSSTAIHVSLKVPFALPTTCSIKGLSEFVTTIVCIC